MSGKETQNENNAAAPDELAQRTAFREDVYNWLQCVAAALLICVLSLMFLARLIDVQGTSMLPTLHDRDKLFVSNLFYTPKRGDVVVFRKAAYREEPLVKRVIATGGETVDIDFERHVVTVDGVELDEPYIAELTANRENFSGPLTVPEGQLFVMGDNRNNSHDSRRAEIGLIDERYVIGRAYFVVSPFSSMKALM